MGWVHLLNLTAEIQPASHCDNYQRQTKTSCRWQTRATCCITANVLQTNNVDALCDKLATEQSWQRFTSKVANLQQSHLHLTYCTCIWHLHWGDPFEFCQDFRHQKLDSLGYRVALFVSVEHRLVTVGRTDTRRQLIPALASVMQVKTKRENEKCIFFLVIKT